MDLIRSWQPMGRSLLRFHHKLGIAIVAVWHTSDHYGHIVEYRGPAWLVGYRSYPICGVFGLLAMVILTLWVVV